MIHRAGDRWGLFLMAIIAAMAALGGAYFYVRKSSAVAPSPAIPIELEVQPINPRDESPVVAPVPM